MGSEATANNIRNLAAEALAAPIDQLVARAAWGELNFEAIRPELSLAFDVLEQICVLPVEELPDQILDPIFNSIREFRNIVEEIRGFTLEGDPTSRRNQLQNQATAAVTSVLSTSAYWMNYLAKRHREDNEDLSAIEQAISESKEELASATAQAEEQLAALRSIVSAARDASADVGVAQYTTEFGTRAGEFDKIAKKWLVATGISGGLTLFSALYGFVWRFGFEPLSWPAHEVSNPIEFAISKVLIVGLFLAGTIWSGSLYRAARHQAETNRHRQTAIKTFEAFVEAAKDEATKNAVLLETTKSIFAIVPTGYVKSSDGGEGDFRVLEMIRNLPASPS